MEEELSEREYQQIADHFGGTWCDCLFSIMSKITSKKLAAYCIAKGYEQVHPPEADELGIRYDYKLRTDRETERQGETEITRERNILAQFGEFHHRPVETTQAALRGIMQIAIHEQRSPHEVALEVINTDDSQVPEPRQVTPQPIAPMAPNTTRRTWQRPTSY